MKNNFYYIFLVFITILFTLSASHICQASSALTFNEVWADAGSGISGANTHDGLASPYCLTVSPDNNNVYVTGFMDNALVVFSRAADGLLTFNEVWADAGSGISGANTHDGLGMGQSIAVSPDGNNLYVVGSGDNALVVFDRNLTTGLLTFNEVWADEGSGISGANTHDGLNWTSGVAVSPDNKSVYVTAEGDNALVVFDRNLSTGALTFKEVWADAGSGISGANTHDGLGGALHVDVSSDNKSVYVTAAGDSALVVFDRNLTTGLLTFNEVWADAGSGISGANTHDGLATAFDIDISPNDETVYATGMGDSALVVFDRNLTTGALTFNQVWADEDSTISGAILQDGLAGTGGVAVSSDNNNVYVTGSGDNALVVFDRAISGALTFNQVWADEDSTISGATFRDGLAGVEGLDTSGDNGSVYVAGASDSAVVNFYILQASQPGDYYVSIDSGNDVTGDGSEANPWKTLHYAMARINAYVGSPEPYTLNVASGTYSIANGEEDAVLIVSQSDVDIIGGTGSPILDGSAGTNWIVGIETTGSNITVRDLEIRNFSNVGINVQGNSSTIYNCDVHDNDTIGIEISTDGTVDGGTIKKCDVHHNQTGIGIIDAQNIVVEQNYVHHNTGPTTGIYVSLATTGVEIKKNLIENNATGIQIYGCSPLVERNEIKDNGTGIKITGVSSNDASPKIYNNLIYDTNSTMGDGIIVEVESGTTAAPELYHNTIDDGSSNGIDVYGYMGTATPDILFNIITNFDMYGIYNSEGNPSINYNDVWNNSSGAYSNCSPTNDISLDPKYEADHSIPYDSPCVDAIPKATGDATGVNLDIISTKRPKDKDNINVGNEKYDIGAYEYPPNISYPYSLPGGTGLETDYRIFTVPVHIGGTLQAMMEADLGTYNPSKWRVFAWDPVSETYIEINDHPSFESLGVEPGKAFWIISMDTTSIDFHGSSFSDGTYYIIHLKPGWNLFGLPWPDTDIDLGNIAVSDGTNNYWITGANNTLTQKGVWDYIGASGYVQLTSSGDLLKAGDGYWIKVLVNKEVDLLVPPDNSGGYFTAMSYRGTQANTDSDEEPPAPPGGVTSNSTNTTSKSGTSVAAEGNCFISTIAGGSGF